MRKGTSTYKMSKAGKIYLAHCWNKKNRRALHRSVVDAELSAADTYRPKGKREEQAKE